MYVQHLLSISLIFKCSEVMSSVELTVILMQAPTVTVILFPRVDIDILGHLKVQVYIHLYHALSRSGYLSLFLGVDMLLFWVLLSDSVYTH